jgi:CDP-diacylglycerol--serine O-phosphatidyltransferase
MNKIAILPTLLTLGNGVCGFAAIALAARIQPGMLADNEAANLLLLSGGLILLAMVFDALDGYVARLSRTASQFGAQLDSLCDAVSFGAAPAFLILRLGQEWDRDVVRRLIAVVAALYLVCTLLRLARFNIENTMEAAPGTKRFRGLPSPAAAGCIASLALLRGEFGFAWSGIGALDDQLVRQFVMVATPLGGVIVALLMVSRLPYVHINRLLQRRRGFAVIVQAVFALALLSLMPYLAPLLVFWAYALQAPLWHGFLVALRKAERGSADPPTG